MGQFEGLRTALALGGCVLTASLACSRTQAVHEVRWLELTQVRPEQSTAVYLNERLVLHFSESLDSDTVHDQSVRITGEDGQPARGEWSVAADRLEFTPAPVLSRELDDGGFEPGGRYRVDLVGFPAPHGLRGRGGAPLRANLRYEFSVISVADRASRVVFEDSSPTRGWPLVLATPSLAQGEPILIRGEEPVDPSSLEAEDFELRKRSPSGQVARATEIPLTVRLVQNSDPRAWMSSGATVIELRPRDTPLEPGSYVLRMARGGRVNDLGGHAMPLFNPTAGRSLEVRVEAGRRGSRAGLAGHVESFSTAQSRSSEAWEHADGMAAWRESGRVEVFLPRLAGVGAAGERRLCEAIEVDDLHATRLEQGPDDVAELTQSDGIVLLRSQTSVRLRGLLKRRRSDTSPSAEFAHQWLNSLRDERMDVQRALDVLRENRVPATVIVAGGDLVIDGRVESAAPLLLFAGGRIRVSRDAVIETPKLVFVDLSTEAIAHYLGGHRIGAGQRAAWTLAPVERNVLRTTLRVAVLSSSLPAGGARRFEYGPRVTAHQGSGSARVRYVGDLPVGSSTRASPPVVDDPALLQGCSTLRLLIELEMPPSEGGDDGPWDPPWVDDVWIEYEPLGSSQR